MYKFFQMNVERRIRAFAKLGERICNDISSRQESLLSKSIRQAGIINPWFVESNVVNALKSIAEQWLNYTTLSNWINRYNQQPLCSLNPKNIGVVMAGNIPLVGFHDLLCVLMSGNRFVGKFSSKDSCLMLAITQMLIEIEPEFAGFISIVEGNLKNFDAVIATGSDSTSKYFDYYFRNVPSIIRKHRNSVGIIVGDETSDEYKLLSDDIFTYFGLGCRSVSKVFVPKGFNLVNMLDCFAPWGHLINHNKYANNYEYSRAMFAMNQVKHLDTGFLLVAESEQIESPVGVLFYHEYDSLSSVGEYLAVNSNKIQCVVGRSGICKNEIPFGTAQKPKINDYADGIDTIEFLTNFNLS